MNQDESGFILIDKPVDWTSHDVVAYLRKITGVKKIGHAGTLDPFATGLLIVGIGRAATKRLDEFKGMDKVYEATLQLGATSNTHDLTGTITTRSVSEYPSKKEIVESLKSFEGKQDQIPPMFSAKKVRGKKLYELARKGIEIERKSASITVHELILLQYDESTHQATISCCASTGTYIRTLCYDIGEKLSTGAYCQKLRRTSIGTFVVTNTHDPKAITKTNWKSLIIHP